MKYILVHWTASNETSILTEEFVRDKSMLKDVNKEGMVRFGKLGCKEPKGGWKAYLGRIIFVNERKQLVKQKEKEFLGELLTTIDNIEDYPHPTSSHGKRKRFLSDSELSNDSFTEESNSKKRIADARNAAQNRAFKCIIDRMDPEICNDPDSENELTDFEEHMKSNEELKGKIMELEKELAKERSLVKQLQDANLILQKNLPDLLKQTCKETIKECIVADRKNSSKVKHGPSSLGKQLRNGLLGQEPHSPLRGQRPSSPSSLSHRSPSPTVFHPMDHSSTPRLPQKSTCLTKSMCTIVKSKQVAPEATSLCRHSDDSSSGDGDTEGQQSSSSCPDEPLPPLSSFSDSVQVAEINNTNSERKMTAVLLCILFERSVLANSSVTGKSKEGRPALDPQKVQLIISHVTKRFPKATPSTVKAAMAQKCKDERNATTTRKQKAEKNE